jgi:hypothetical protein
MVRRNSLNSQAGESRFSGHNMELEAPDEVAIAIRNVVDAVLESKGGKNPKP